MSTRVSHTYAVICSLSIWMLAGLGAHHASAQTGHSSLRIHRTDPQGRVSFLVPGPGAATIGAPRGFGRTEAEDLLVQHGSLFGVDDVEQQLVQRPSRTDALGRVQTRFEQIHEGVPVFGGEIRVHQNAQGAFRAANGRFRDIDPGLDTAPTLTPGNAIEAATMEISSANPTVGRVELTIVDPGWYGDPTKGARLAYHIELSDLDVPESEAFFVDAHSGEVLDQWSQLHLALDREIIESGIIVRDEGDPATGNADIDGAYDAAADAYNYFFRGHLRDSYDDAGATFSMVTAHTANCPNAYWYDATETTYYCPGMVTDDIVAHEIGHGITFASSNLIYQNEPGQLNESFSDVFGELVDLFNGDAAFAGTPGGTPWDVQPSGSGTDTPNNLRTTCSPKPTYADGVRWLVSEDTTAAAPFDGAIRDMWDPTCMGHPDKASSPLQDCFPYDSGGVHSGSGIPNHGFAILTDGKTFNGQTVTGIGPIKAAAIWYRAYTVYLTTTSGFGDFAVALDLACTDLEGTTVADPRPGGSSVLITASDCTEVTSVVDAVEFNLPGGTCTVGACCYAITGGCVDNRTAIHCSIGVFHPGQLCSDLNPTCSRPSDTARMVVVLDRSGSMLAIRSSTGNTRCTDAVAAARNDVQAFFRNHPQRSVEIRIFTAVSASLTGGFVDEATAIGILDGLGGSCNGGTALADAICDAVDSFPAGLTVHDRVISINTDGDEAASSGACSGPDSVSAPPPPGNYTAGSWQESVFSKLDGEVIALIRNWTNFGGINNNINPETGAPFGVGSAADSNFLQDFAGVTGGHFTDVYDNGPLPPKFPIDAFGVPALPALGLGALVVGMGGLGIGFLRRR